MASIKDIAKYVGISPASVSIYLNNSNTNRVSNKRKKEIDEAVIKLKYRRNIFAHNLVTSHSKIIGILLPTEEAFFQNLYTNGMLSGLQKRFADRGYSMMFLASCSNNSCEIINDQLKNSFGCDGYILFSTGFCSNKQIHDNIESLLSTNKSFVTMNINEYKEREINQILVSGITQPKALQYLINKGHKNIITILGRESRNSSVRIKDKVIEMLKSKNLDKSINLICYGNYNATDSYEKIVELLKQNKDVSAICAMSDTMAVSAMNAAINLGYRVPEDISIIGRNNSSAAALAQVKLTTLDLSMINAGETAADILIENIEAKTQLPTKKIIINSKIIEGNSVSDISNL